MSALDDAAEWRRLTAERAAIEARYEAAAADLAAKRAADLAPVTTALADAEARLVAAAETHWAGGGKGPAHLGACVATRRTSRGRLVVANEALTLARAKALGLPQLVVVTESIDHAQIRALPSSLRDQLGVRIDRTTTITISATP